METGLLETRTSKFTTRNLRVWHTTLDKVDLFRFAGEWTGESPYQLIARLLRSSESLQYCSNADIRDVMDRKVTTRPGFIVAPIELGPLRILEVQTDGSIQDVSKRVFHFTRVSWTVILARRR